jgi:hypothetical protein
MALLVYLAVITGITVTGVMAAWCVVQLAGRATLAIRRRLF